MNMQSAVPSVYTSSVVRDANRRDPQNNIIKSLFVSTKKYNRYF